MSIFVDQVLSQYHIGSEIKFGNQIIARITQKIESEFEIRDIHGKFWVIKRESLRNVKYPVFAKDLAAAIVKFSPKFVGEGSARRALSEMSIGDKLQESNKCLATLIEITPHPQLGNSLTFEDNNGNQQQIYLNLIPADVNIEEYIQGFRKNIEGAVDTKTEPILLRYFKHEFFPKMLAQMEYDNERWGDTWLMQSRTGQEENIRKRLDEYFDYFEQFEKNIPWFRIVGYAVIAQAREDHPDWLI